MSVLSAGLPTSRRRITLAALILVAVTVLVYLNSFSGAFVFDDEHAILENPAVKTLRPPWEIFFPNPPGLVVNFTLALNYALGGFDVRGYHACNLLIHLLAGLLLFGVIRRTLLIGPMAENYGEAAVGLSLATALIWSVHPLQTESVTYIIQRYESLAGLFYLLTLYSVIRGAASPPGRGWYLLAVGSCALGMATKEVMVTAPVVIFLYDRTFLAGSFRRRKGLYTGLIATWLVLVAVVLKKSYAKWGGFSYEQTSPVSYALTQFGVIVEYLKLSAWPRALCLDRQWPIARTVGEIVPAALLIAGLLIAVLWSLRRRSPLGFAGAWFFLILTPTSSIVPIAGPAFEHRLYLSLAAVVAVAVLSSYRILLRLFPDREKLRLRLSWGLAALIVVLLGVLTVDRNRVYHSPVGMWKDVIAKSPRNPGVRTKLGLALAREGKLEEAEAQYRAVLRTDPGFLEARNNLGNLLARRGELEEAIFHYAEAIKRRPGSAEAMNNLGNALVEAGRIEEGIARYREAIKFDPGFADGYTNLGLAFARKGKLDEAIEHYRRAIEVRPDNAAAFNNLGNALARQGKFREAAGCFRQALRLDPKFTPARSNLERTLREMERGGELK